MHIVQLTPGAGNYYSGAAIRDHALTVALRRLGHDVSFVPLFQKPMLEEEEAWEAPLFYDQARVYRQQQAGIVNRLKSLFMDRQKAAKRIERMTPSERGELQLSLLKGLAGRQGAELRDLVTWLKQRHPDVICISNALLLGLVPELKKELGVPVIVSLQGEVRMLNNMPKSCREEATRLAAELSTHADALIAPSNYHAGEMMRRLNLLPAKVRVIANGIALNSYSVMPAPPPKPTLGFLGRLCEDNGLPTLVKVFKELRKEEFPELQLRIAGAMSDGDLAFMAKVLQPLNSKFGQDIKILRNIPLARKVTFLHSLTVLCATADDEAFGLYLVEAMACGLPVVAPRMAGYTELLEKAGGGALAPSDDPKKMAKTIGEVLRDDARRQELGKAGRAAALEHYPVERLAGELLALIQAVKDGKPLPGEEPPPPKMRSKDSARDKGEEKDAGAEGQDEEKTSAGQDDEEKTADADAEVKPEVDSQTGVKTDEPGTNSEPAKG